MASLPTRSRYICQNCIETISRHSSYRGPLATDVQRRYNSTKSKNARSSLAKRAARGNDKIIWARERDRRRRLSRSGSTAHAGGSTKKGSTLKSTLEDGQYITRSQGVSISLPSTLPIDKLERPSLPSDPSPASDAPIWSPEKAMHSVKLHHVKLQGWNMYWETLPPTIAEKTQAQNFFVKTTRPRFIQSVPKFRIFPESDVPEVAFVGRSNVGKSSLLNAIVNADTKALLARTSATPGFTKTMNLYGQGPEPGVRVKKQPSGFSKIVGPGGLTIVDMPGYGEGSLSEWGTEIMKYLQGRMQLRRVFVLIDAQHGIKDKDRSLLASLRLGGISHQVILSKLDKIYIPEARDIKRFHGNRLDRLKPAGNLADVTHAMDKLRRDIQPIAGSGALGEILACSSEILVDGRRLGIDAVRYAMLQAVGFPFRRDQAQVERTKMEGPRIRTVKADVAHDVTTADGTDGTDEWSATVKKLERDSIEQTKAERKRNDRVKARRERGLIRALIGQRTV